MKLFYIDTVFGCGIRKAEDLDSAWEETKREVGYGNVRDVHEASGDEIAWVRAMGGDVPEIKGILE